MKNMCSLSRFVAFIALLSASTALRAEDAPTLPPPNAAATQNADSGTMTPPAAADSAPAAAPSAPAAGVAAPAAVATAPVSPATNLPTTIEPRPEYGQFGGTVSLPATVNLNEVPDVIVKAAAKRKWTVLSQAPGKIVMSNQNGKWVSQLTMLWTADKIVIYSNTTKGGKPTLPNSWIDNLRRDIMNGLNPAPVAIAKKKS